MAFSFTTDIFNYMDTVTKEFVASNLGIVISHHFTGNWVSVDLQTHPGRAVYISPSTR